MKQFVKFQSKEALDLLIEFFYLAIIFIVPLYFSIIFPTFNIFELSKLVIFKIFVYLLLFFTLLKLIFYWPKEYFNLKSIKESAIFSKIINFVPLLFIIGLGITLFFSLNPRQSFFGSYDRQAGYESYLFYFFWFVLLVFNILTVDNHFSKKDLDEKSKLEKRFDRIIKVAVFSSFLVAVYGILQILGIDFLVWSENPLLTKRTISTLGQPNFLASWLLLVIPLSAYLFYKSKVNLVKFFYFLVLVAQLICLFSTSSRGGVISLGLMILLFFVYLVRQVKLKKVFKFFISFSLLGLLIISFVALNYFSPGRLNSLLDFRSGSLAARVNFYEAAVNAISKKPFFGYGIENGGEVFFRYYRPDWGIYANVGATTDRAHNIILDTALTTGFFGLFLSIILYYYFFQLAGKNIRHKKNGPLSLALALGGAAYLFSLLFNFSFATGEIYFWLFLALLLAINISSAEQVFKLKFIAREKSRRPIGIIIIFGVLIIVAGGIFYQFRILRADYYFKRLNYIFDQKQYFTVFTLADYVAEEKANPINQAYYNRLLGERLSVLYPEKLEETVKLFSFIKLKDLEEKLGNNSYENILVKAQINFALNKYTEAEKYYLEVLKISPYWPKTYIELGDLFSLQGRFPEAIFNYEQALKNLPVPEDKRLNAAHREIVNVYRKTVFKALGDIYSKQKNYELAEKNYQAALINYPNDLILLKKLSDIYYQRGNFSKAREYNLHGAARNPLDYSWPLFISLIYKEEGNQENAKFYFEQALKLAPDNEELLKLKNEYK